MPPGTDPGAPAIPKLKWKLFWTTVVASAIFGALYTVYVFRLITFDDLASWFGTPRR